MLWQPLRPVLKSRDPSPQWDLKLMPLHCRVLHEAIAEQCGQMSNHDRGGGGGGKSCGEPLNKVETASMRSMKQPVQRRVRQFNHRTKTLCETLGQDQFHQCCCQDYFDAFLDECAPKCEFFRKIQIMAVISIETVTACERRPIRPSCSSRV